MHDIRPQVPARSDREPPDDRLSRRRALQTLAGCATLAGLAPSLLGGAPVYAQSKVSQKTATYQDHPNDGKNCATCNYFRPPQSCQLVDGTISPNGWCKFYLKKPQQ